MLGKTLGNASSARVGLVRWSAGSRWPHAVDPSSIMWVLAGVLATVRLCWHDEGCIFTGKGLSGLQCAGDVALLLQRPQLAGVA